MFQFFHGWRRKLGVATLMMALVFMGGWLRSNLMLDSMMFPAVIHKTNSKVTVTIDILASAKNSICWERAHEESGETEATEEDIYGDPSYPQWQSSSSLPDWDDAELKLKWRWRWCGFGFGEPPHEHGAWSTFLIIPYWSIVVPLTLISSYLLLVKPKLRKVTKENDATAIADRAIEGGAPSEPSI